MFLAITGLTTSAASGINFSESFDTAASNPFTDTYTDWVVSGGAAHTQLVSGGQLQITIDTTSGTVTPTLSASNIAGTSEFDVSTIPLVVTADVGGSGSAGNYQVSLVVGDLVFLFHPGSAGGFHRVEKLSTSVVRANTNMGFTPANDGTTYAVSVSVIENGTDYDFDYSIGSYNAPTLSVAQSSVVLDRVGFRDRGGLSDTGFFDNLTVTAVPEPSTALLLAFGLAGSAASAERRGAGA